ncbi:MAG: hypothetical protein GY854_18575 [Deltaproteobacteria bacterium]|nr:hypothetical protein [Deltaproteobacteria bacterium]
MEQLRASEAETFKSLGYLLGKLVKGFDLKIQLLRSPENTEAHVRGLLVVSARCDRERSPEAASSSASFAPFEIDPNAMAGYRGKKKSGNKPNEKYPILQKNLGCSSRKPKPPTKSESWTVRLRGTL